MWKSEKKNKKPKQSTLKGEKLKFSWAIINKTIFNFLPLQCLRLPYLFMAKKCFKLTQKIEPNNQEKMIWAKSDVTIVPLTFFLRPDSFSSPPVCGTFPLWFWHAPSARDEEGFGNAAKPSVTDTEDISTCRCKGCLQNQGGTK